MCAHKDAKFFETTLSIYMYTHLIFFSLSEKLFSTQILKIREGSNPTISTTSLTEAGIVADHHKIFFGKQHNIKELSHKIF